MHQVHTTGTHGHGQGPRFGQTSSVQEPSLLRSDAALLAAVKAGDAGAARRLHDRHAPAVEITADLVGADAPATSWAGLLGGLAEGEALGLPVRATWLARAVGHDLGELDAVARSTDVVWAAYTALSATWQTALWHHEVEGEQTDGVGRVLGCLPEDAATSVANAGMSLRRGVVAAHECGPRAECRAVVDQVRVDTHAELPTRLVRALREHARHCDDCLPLVRDTFRVAFSLREVLAAHVLGPYSEEYLRSRVELAARAAAAPRARSIGSAPSLRRTGRSVLTVGAVGLTAAAVAGALVIHPSELPSTGGGDPSASVSISLPGATHAGKHAAHRGQIRLAAAHLPQHVTGATTGKHAATTTKKSHGSTSSSPSEPSAPSTGTGSTPTAPSTPPTHTGKPDPGTGDGGTKPTGPSTPPSGSSDPTPPSDPSPVSVSGGKGKGTTVTVTPPAGTGLPPVSVTVPPVGQVVGTVTGTVQGVTGAAGSAVSGTVGGLVGGLGGGHHG